MKKINPLFFLTIVSFFCTIFAQNPDSLVAKQVKDSALLHSASIEKTAPSTPSSSISPSPADTVLHAKDSVSASAPQPPQKKIKLIKREYNGRQQVIVATAMMVFVVAIFTAAQQWNPQ